MLDMGFFMLIDIAAMSKGGDEERNILKFDTHFLFGEVGIESFSIGGKLFGILRLFLGFIDCYLVNMLLDVRDINLRISKIYFLFNNYFLGNLLDT